MCFFCMVIFKQDQEGDKDKAATSKKVSQMSCVTHNVGIEDKGILKK